MYHAAVVLSTVASLAAALLFPTAAWADAEEDRAVEAIRKSGGYVAVNEGVPPSGVRFFVKTDIDAVMRQLKHLKHLDMVLFQPNTPVTDEQLKGLAVIKGLKLLDLNSPNVTDKALEIIGRHQHLEVLRIGGKFTGSGLKALADLPHLRELEYGSSGTRGGYSEVQGFKKLEKLWTSGNLTEEDLKGIGKITTLKTLSIAHATVTDASLKELANLNNLKTLGLHDTEITDRGLKGLEGLMNLEHISLGRTKITSQGLKSLGTLKNLQSLGLSETKVGDDGVQALLGLEKLRSLDLSYTRLTDAGLLQLGQLSALNYVSVRGSQVTAKGFNTFFQTFRIRID